MIVRLRFRGAALSLIWFLALTAGCLSSNPDSSLVGPIYDSRLLGPSIWIDEALVVIVDSPPSGEAMDPWVLHVRDRSGVRFEGLVEQHWHAGRAHDPITGGVAYGSKGAQDLLTGEILEVPWDESFQVEAALTGRVCGFVGSENISCWSPHTNQREAYPWPGETDEGSRCIGLDTSLHLAPDDLMVLACDFSSYYTDLRYFILEHKLGGWKAIPVGPENDAQRDFGFRFPPAVFALQEYIVAGLNTPNGTALRTISSSTLEIEATIPLPEAERWEVIGGLQDGECWAIMLGGKRVEGGHFPWPNRGAVLGCGVEITHFVHDQEEPEAGKQYEPALAGIFPWGDEVIVSAHGQVYWYRDKMDIRNLPRISISPYSSA